MDKLNYKQRIITMHVWNIIKTGKTQIKMFLSGSAGVSKSEVIIFIFQLVSNYFNNQLGINTNSLKVMLYALSGKAAFLISGITLHTAFALPISECNNQIMPELASSVANTISEKMCEVKL